jgi:mono/diheme cytochrome c family protein
LVVRRVALLLSLFFAAACAAFAWFSSTRVAIVAPENGAASFEQSCAACHTVGELIEPLSRASDDADDRAAFLERHAGVTRAQAERILDYVEHRAARPRETTR